MRHTGNVESKIKTNKKQKVKTSLRDNYSRGELAKQILKGLAVGGIIVASFALPNLPQVLTLFGAKNRRDRYKIARTIRNLEKRKLIDFYEKGDNQILEITEKGEKKILKYKIDEMRINRPKKWDGYWRIIIFDIPERYKRARNALTLKLKEMEFYPLQKSVFICPFECQEEIDFIGEFFDVRKFIYYFTTKDLDEEYLKVYYNL